MALRFIKSKPSDVSAFIRSAHVNEDNCTLHGIDEYPNWFKDKPPRYDYSFYCGVITIYLFLAIAIICDGYCVPAVERISYQFGMSYNVAGATLMATATSSPEFFINLYATFLTEGDMGIGTIVGSSVFNTLAITACCCLYTGADFSIDWWPVTRDLLWYSVSIFFLTIFLWDDLIFWWESLILVLLYIFNVANLLMDRQCQDRIRNKDEPSKFICFVPKGEVKDFSDMPDPDDNEDAFNFTYWPEESAWEKLIWILSYPWECLFFFTIPNVRRQCSHSCIFACLIMSIIWVSFLTYLCSWSITVIGYNFFIPDSVMGIVFLAAGTSIPEAISSVIVTRKGYGSMAVCNAIGSNTVDILICLGGPWLIKSIFLPVKASVKAVSIISEGLVYSSGCLLLSAVMFYVFFMATRFQLGTSVGILCLITYFSYVIIAVTIEMLFFDKRLPHCLHRQMVFFNIFIPILPAEKKEAKQHFITRRQAYVIICDY